MDPIDLIYNNGPIGPNDLINCIGNKYKSNVKVTSKVSKVSNIDK